MSSPLKMDPRSRETDAETGIIYSLTAFMSDLLTLAELQGSLLVAETRQALMHSLWPITFFALSGLMAIFCIPLLMALAVLSFVELGGFTYLQSCLFTLLLSVLEVVILASFGYGLWRAQQPCFEQSKREWKSNYLWISTVIRRLASASNPSPGPTRRF